MKSRGMFLFLGSIVLALALLMFLRCGEDGGGGRAVSPVTPVSRFGSGYIDGVVYDASDDTPLEGTRVTARGVSGSVTSDREGKFYFPIAETRDYIITIEKPGYTYAQRRARGVLGRDVAVDPVYLVPLDPKVTRIGPGGGTHTDSTGRIELVFPPGAVSKEVDVRTTMLERGRDLPYLLPALSKFTVALNLKPDNLVLKEPAQMKIENFLGFPAGTPVPVGMYTQESGEWIADGMGVVSTDGSVMEYRVSHFSVIDCNYPIFSPEDSGVMRGVKDETSERVHRCEEDGAQGSAKVGFKTGNLYSYAGSR